MKKLASLHSDKRRETDVCTYQHPGQYPYPPDHTPKLLGTRASPRTALQWHIPTTTYQLLHKRVNRGWFQGLCEGRGQKTSVRGAELSAGIGQLVPIVTLTELPPTSVTALTELRDTLVTGIVPANQTLVGEYLSLQKSTVTIHSQEITLRFAAVCEGENYHCFHPASGNMKAPNQGPH